MKITQEPLNPPANDWSEDNHPRSKGLHLGQIIADIEEVLHGVGNKWEGEWAMAGGFIWERVLSREFIGPYLATGKIVRPGELELDGIFLTPDGYDTHDNVLEEWKCTWKSSNNPIEGPKFWRYWTQCKAYCTALGTRCVRLRVLYLMGNYRGGGPHAMTYTATFSQKELDNNWNMIVNHAKTKGWLNEVPLRSMLYHPPNDNNGDQSNTYNPNDVCVHVFSYCQGQLPSTQETIKMRAMKMMIKLIIQVT